jgi:hypothetical protein
LISIVNATPFDIPAPVVDTSVALPTTLVTISTVTPNIKSGTSSTVSVEHDLKPREDEAEGDNTDWYLTCAGDDVLSLQFCQQRLHGYYCRRNQVHHNGKEYIMCAAACVCKLAHPTLGCHYVRGMCFNSQADIDQFGQSLANPANQAFADIDGFAAIRTEALQARTKNPALDTQVQEPQPLYSDPQSNAIDLVEQQSEQPMRDGTNRTFPPVLKQRDTEQPAHNFAIVCIEKDWTRMCSGGDLKYSCDKNGRITKKKLDLYCDAICGCVDLAATPRCFRNGAWLTTCFDTLETREISGNELLALQSNHDLTETNADAAHTSGDLPMYCVTNGTIDTRLTEFCSEHHYHCSLAMMDGHAKSSLHSDMETVNRCADNCYCVGNSVRSKFENHVAHHVEARSEAEQTSSTSELIGVSVYYCIAQTSPYVFELDMRLIEFCENENYYCANNSPNDAIGFPPTTPDHTEKYPKCFDNCHCIHFEHRNKINPRSEVSSDNRIKDNQSADSGDTSDAVVHIPTMTADYRLRCISNYNITTYCQRYWGYNCDNHGVVHHGEFPDSDCDAYCMCDNPYWHDEDNAEAGTASIEAAPPKGVPSQTVDQYILNCGNTKEGPPYCSKPERGYFCNDKMQLVRTSTKTDSGITYCNNFCTCQFKYARPCLNEFGVDWCIEWWDGTVRDAHRTKLALGIVKNLFIMANGTLVVDKADGEFPYWALDD